MSEPAKDLQELMDALEAVLAGGARAEILDGIRDRGELDDWLRRLRTTMSDHAFATGARRYDLSAEVRRLDVRTRKDGFRVLHAWDHTRHEFTQEIVPVLIIDFFERAATRDPDGPFTLSLLLDYYFLHLLTLCAVRVWDADDPDAALARLTRLVHALQGEHGSGHHFVADAETLLIYALSQFHPEEQAYDRLIERIGTLEASRRVTFACVSAAVLSAHLRWGFWLMYGRDVVRMRDDNVGDYPWLVVAVLTLLRAWVDATEEGASEEERDPLVEALLLGLAADPWVFTGSPPPALANHRVEHEEVRRLLVEHGESLRAELEGHRPTKDRYAPLSLHFNFPHNALVAIVTLALLEGKPQPLTLNQLFVGELDNPPEGETQEGLARALMAFSAGPERRGHRGAMLVAYDPLSGMRSFSMTTKALRELA